MELSTVRTGKWSGFSSRLRFLIASYSCPDCNRSVHRFCGTPYGKDEEGYGQRIWCTKSEQCQLSATNVAGTPAELLSATNVAGTPAELLSATNVAGTPAQLLSATPAEIHLRNKLSSSQRSEILEKHISNPKMSQTKLARWAREMFSLPKLSQATISNILKDFRVTTNASNTLTVKQAQLIYKQAQGTKMTQKQLAEWAKKEFKMARAPSQGTISNVLNKKRHMDDDIPDRDLNLKRKRVIKHPDLDKALAEWIIQCQERRVVLNWQIIQEKAKRFAKDLNIEDDECPTFSDGWLQKFLDRHGMKSLKLSGEAGSADMDAVRAELPVLQSLISEYPPSDVFNMDETGLFYCLAPDRTIATRQIAGLKKDKTRITIALCANADGTEKRELFFLGHFQKPRAFRKKKAEEYGLYYRWNRKAWMTSLLFQEWLLKFDRDMKRQNRQILLLLDNAPSHAVASIELTNITVLFFPPNTTSQIQPMDAGIIAAFKKRYRTFQIGHALDKDAAGEQNIYKVDILKAMKWCTDAWKMLAPVSIRNCWLHTCLLDSHNSVLKGDIVHETESTEPDETLQQQLIQLNLECPLPLDEYLAQDQSDDLIHHMLSDHEILSFYDGNNESEPEDLDPVTHLPDHTLDEKIHALAICLHILDDSPLDNFTEIKKIRRVLYDFSRERAEVRLSQLKQTDIRSFYANCSKKP
jgi:hypothetical protein